MDGARHTFTISTSGDLPVRLFTCHGPMPAILHILSMSLGLQTLLPLSSALYCPLECRQIRSQLSESPSPGIDLVLMSTSDMFGTTPQDDLFLRVSDAAIAAKPRTTPEAQLVTSCEGVGLQKTLRFSELTFVPKDGKHTATLTVCAAADC